VYDDIISVENLLDSWEEFLDGKKKRKDVAEFSVQFMDNILTLQRELAERTYRHGPYYAFKINDPKPREIHKASVRDRLVHHAICRILYPYFDRQFIHDSYSCRLGKGTQRANNRFREFAREVSKNHTRTVWVLKCDIRKFFANINHETLKTILRWHIKDTAILSLLEQIIDSFHTHDNPAIGLPLGNLSSQLLVNVYMNKFDQFMKRKLKIQHYVRYADDFIILHERKDFLVDLLPKISQFLETELQLSLHPKKVFIKTISSGVDFLGWVHFSHHRVLRTSTKRRMIKKVKQSQSKETLASYLGILTHGNAYDLAQRVKATKNQRD